MGNDNEPAETWTALARLVQRMGAGEVIHHEEFDALHRLGTHRSMDPSLTPERRREIAGQLHALVDELEAAGRGGPGATAFRAMINRFAARVD